MSLITEDAVAVLPSHVADLERHLQGCPYWSVRQLACRVESGRVVVSGTVPSYYLKQVAEYLVAKVVGLAGVNCEIDVLAD